MDRAPTPAELSLAARDLSLAGLQLHHALAATLAMAPQDLAAMTHLGRDGALTPTELRERLRLRAGSVTAVIDRLQARGDVRRRPHPEDGRSTVVALTDRGSGRARAELAPMIEAVRVAAAELSSRERQLVAAFLAAATREMQSQVAALPAGKPRRAATRSPARARR